MGYAYSFWKKQEYAISFLQENVEMVVYSAAAFFIPFFVGHPQIIVGVLVNAALIMAALNVSGYKLLPVILLPSLGVLSRGLIFGPYTIFLVYMIPFIWVGNAILVYAFKEFNLNKGMNKWAALLLGSLLKAAFLFIAAFVLVKLSVLPVLFLTTMGMFQIYTAILGGIVAFGAHAAKRKISA